MNYKIILSTIKIPLIFIIIMWVIRFVEYYSQISLYSFGIFPRSCNGLIGIMTSTFIHIDFSHLINNTYPLIILGSLLSFFYEKKAYFSAVFLLFTASIRSRPPGPPAVPGVFAFNIIINSYLKQMLVNFKLYV